MEGKALNLAKRVAESGRNQRLKFREETPKEGTKQEASRCDKYTLICVAAFVKRWIQART